jgi:hypothetical protein
LLVADAGLCFAAAAGCSRGTGKIVGMTKEILECGAIIF